MTLFGVHIGLQHTTPDELRTVWRRVEDLGFGWISVWDHFYGATGRPDDAACLEAVSMHAALACSTSRVRCGSLVYSIGYRHPAVLAKAITAVDLLSGGRAEIGLGAGWAKVEYDAYGIAFPEAKVRLDQLEEGVQCLRGLLHDDVTDFAGDHFTLTNARNEPRPVQARLPIWIGGGGEKRTLKIAAKYADGWNVPFIGPDTFAHKRSVLHGFCDSVERDPSQIRCAINVGIASDDANLRHQFGAISDLVRPGVLIGSDDEILDRIGQYVDAGADQVNISSRAPFDIELLERFSHALKLGMSIHVRAPGRVNLIGDHTDYTGGMVLPMTIDRWTEIRGAAAENITLVSADEPQPAVLDLGVDDLQAVQPQWAKYVAGVVAEMRPHVGFSGTVATDIPIGAGLSSSAALELAVALALGFDGDALSLAQLCRRAEVKASGVPCGLMDQLVIAAGTAGHALLIDCGDLTIEPVRLPDDIEVVVRFVTHRTLAGSAYADRVAECAAAEAVVGPLRTAALDDTKSIADPIIRARAQHVISENQRVRDFAAVLRDGDLRAAGALMVASHDSIRDLYQTSTPVMDAAVEQLIDQPGVYGARMTGGGFGGCVVALTEPGTLTDGWVVRAVDGAHRVEQR